MSRSLALRTALIAAACWLPAGMAWAGPSFDCARAQLPIEQVLCADAELGDLEGQMTRLYQQRLAAAGAADANTLRSDMGYWLAALVKDCGVPRSGALDPAAMERVRPCLAGRYRERIAMLGSTAPLVQPAVAAAAPPPDPAPPPAAAVAPAQPAATATVAATAASGSAAPVPEMAIATAWRVLPYGKGLVAIISQEENNTPYATASIYCDSAFKAEVPVFLYRLGNPIPSADDVQRLNQAIQGATLKVDGALIASVTRRDLGHSFSGFQLLPDGTLSYMMLIDPAVLEQILHGQRLEAVVQLPPDTKADPRYAGQSFPLTNSRKAIVAALKRCV
jgi:uncharacterized protein